MINRPHFSENIPFDHRNRLKKKERIVYACMKFPTLEGSGERVYRKKERNGRNLLLREDDGDGPRSGVCRRIGTNFEK
jgi:hypothetical protein